MTIGHMQLTINECDFSEEQWRVVADVTQQEKLVRATDLLAGCNWSFI